MPRVEIHVSKIAAFVLSLDGSGLIVADVSQEEYHTIGRMVDFAPQHDSVTGDAVITFDQDPIHRPRNYNVAATAVTIGDTVEADAKYEADLEKVRELLAKADEAMTGDAFDWRAFENRLYLATQQCHQMHAQTFDEFVVGLRENRPLTAEYITREFGYDLVDVDAVNAYNAISKFGADEDSVIGCPDCYPKSCTCG